MEDSDRRMLVDMFEPQVPNGRLVMKQEYRINFAYGLTEKIPELFPDVRSIVHEYDGGVYFIGPKTRLFFPSDRDSVDILIYNYNSRYREWDYMPFLRHKEIEKKVINILKDLYGPNEESLESLTLKRSEIGWSDPITMYPIRSGDEIIRINKDNRFIFKRKALERSWLGKEKKNPLTNEPPEQIEEFIANVTEDAGAEPITGGSRKRRRKTLRRKNLRSSRKR
jgi:hypothetical protein